MNDGLAAVDWLGRGWLLALAFSVAVLLLAVLRKPCRHVFGTERAFQLWLLPPLAMLASQLPHAAVAPVTVFSALVPTLTSAAITLPMPAASLNAGSWPIWVLAWWLAGIAMSLLLAARAQMRYRRRLQGALPMSGLALPCPGMRATTADIGPALVGAWHCWIVLPVDFEQRYSDVEQSLILAHEATHARRRDGWWCLLGRVLAAALWFHPLAWWALAALRHDLELACDAAVLRNHSTQRHTYAQAMLKTQLTTFALPAGCAWSPRHPVTERIAMLKLRQPNALCRRTGGTLVALLAAGLVTVVYATTPIPQANRANSHADHYTLKLDLALDGKPARLHATTCLKPERYYTYTVAESDSGQLPPWRGRFTVVPGDNGELEVRGEVSGGSLAAPSYPRLRMRPGQHGTIQIGQQARDKQGQLVGDHTIRIDVTPSIGC
ncbi:MAG: M56 family metallopeptidase [Rhodanobacter sp.]